jgi:hypothetical protein
MRQLAAVVVAAVVMSGCGGGGGDAPTPGTSRTLSCTFPSEGCQAVTAILTDAQQAALQTNCGNGGGSFVAGACSTTGMLTGYCHYTGMAILGGTVSASIDEYYDASTWTAQSAQTYCETPPAGTWIP